jgi:hypothetical protein
MVGKLKKRSGADEGEKEGALPELNPWREVGWIFRDGEAIAVERLGEEARARKVDV